MTKHIVTRRTIKRLPEVKSLIEILPKGTEGGKEFARVVDLLLFHEARREGKKLSLFNDAAGDYYGLDSFKGDVFRKEGTTGYQYKFYPSPLTAQHRKGIVDSLKKTAEHQKTLKLKKWILVTPQDFLESSSRRNGGDVTWFEEIRSNLNLNFEIEQWGHKKLLSLFLQTPSLCLFYYPELTSNAANRRTIEDTRRRYDDNLVTLYRNIEFVGMSVYKQEATKGVPMEHIYIPLTAVPEIADEHEGNAPRVDPLKFLEPGRQRIVLGDPGSGKSTLLRFLTLVGTSRALQKRCHAKPDKRLPVLITLRRYADELKTRRQLPLIDYIQECVQGDFSLKSADIEFFEYYLETGQAILLFDGLDELPNPHFKQTIRDRIRSLITTYPGNSVVVTSRIVGYESNLRFSEKEFSHFRLTNLQISEMKAFVRDWYQARIENLQEREVNAADLIRILENEGSSAIRELAENPLLLTIVALVHRIDAVLPDERVVLYQKCTETLLNTWHTWKYRDAEVKNRGREERRNRRRMEAIANWMHGQSIGVSKAQRAVVPYVDLQKFLTAYITQLEGPYDSECDPQDVASEFLEFVKKKAGLLIEVGDERYSFVHQTFQEYLTASYITTSNQGGVEGIWGAIKDYCNDARWLEVIRLLVADLQSTTSQQIIIEKLLLLKPKKGSSKPLLLTGLLIDGVEPAELHVQEIMEQLIIAISRSSAESQFRPFFTMLRTWLSKENSDQQVVKDSLDSLLRNADTKEQELRYLLIASALGWPEFVNRAQEDDSVASKTADLLRLFAMTGNPRVGFDRFAKELRSLWAIQDYFSLTSAYTNLIAAMCASVTSSLPKGVGARRRFEEQLTLLGVSFYGPFSDYNYNMLVLAGSSNSSKRDLIASVPKHFGLLNENHKLRGFLTSLAKLRGSRRGELLEIARTRLHSAVGDDEAVQSLLKREGPLPTLSEEAVAEDAWESILRSPKLCSHVIDVVLVAFRLNSPHWKEAARVCFLSSIPNRLEELFSRERVQTLETKLSGRPTQDTIYEAARLLLFDCWLAAFTTDDLLRKRPLFRLARIAEKIEAPPLRIASCLRAIFLGDRTRDRELSAMIHSAEPAYRRIFEDCFWLEDLPTSNPHRRASRKK